MGSEKEALARNFYVDGLGLTEVPKPPSLQQRGGCWFRKLEGDRVLAEVHLGLDPGFVPSDKAHPAFLVENIAGLEAMARRIEVGGYELSWVERHSFEGYQRFHCRDPFGNRIEILALDSSNR
ncbi:VOC family protein [Arthrobacter sp. MYb213]|uniref:VOC family protein n=1 Tax=Arthrobacter sp. MYb213 TaxID=1848595 RepID=UPI002570C26B|nr:VOC family protein [Arthrobacter sp. MYb213]